MQVCFIYYKIKKTLGQLVVYEPRQKVSVDNVSQLFFSSNRISMVYKIARVEGISASTQTILYTIKAARIFEMYVVILPREAFIPSLGSVTEYI